MCGTLRAGDKICRAFALLGTYGTKVTKLKRRILMFRTSVCRITAIRRKYEMVRFADHTNDPDPSKMMAQMPENQSSSTDPASVKPASQPVAGFLWPS